MYVPGHLVLNDPAHPVPVVISGVSVEEGQWRAEAPAGRYVFAVVNGWETGSQYDLPTIFPGGKPVGTLDQIPEILQVIKQISCIGPAPCVNADKTHLYYTGSSRGATVPEAMMCDGRAVGLVAGVGIDSNTLITHQGTTSASPLYCPALGEECGYAPSCTGAVSHSVSLAWLWGSLDTVFTSSTCAVGSDCEYTGFVQNNNAGWTFGTGQEAGDPVVSGRNVFGAWLGCSQTPALSQNTSFGWIKYFANCSRSAAPAATATGLIQVTGCGHQPQGCNGVDVPTQFWNFWSRYPK